uniref:DUF4897 domain-containing protein n=1 Tax=Mesoaciditoga lauensis TaxID=1495039 RepID=A0A7V3VS84_9BACT
MSRYNKFLWIMVGVLVVVMVVQFIYTTNRKPPYEQLSYYANYTFGYATPVSIYDDVQLYYANPSDLQKALQEFNKLTPQDKFNSYTSMFDNLSKSTKIQFKAISYQSSATIIGDNTLQFNESSVVDGIVTLNGGEYRISMGNIGIKLDKGSEIVFTFPQGTRIISVKPTPTTVSDGILTWKGPVNLTFPEVVYTK